MAECLFESTGVSVTQARVTIGGTDYPVRNISAVSVEKKAASGCLPGVFIVPGLLIIAYGGMMLANHHGGGAPLAIGILLCVLGIIFFAVASPEYNLVFTSNSGRTVAYTTKSADEIMRIKAAINQAIDSQAR